MINHKLGNKNCDINLPRKEGSISIPSCTCFPDGLIEAHHGETIVECSSAILRSDMVHAGGGGGGKSGKGNERFGTIIVGAGSSYRTRSLPEVLTILDEMQAEIDHLRAENAKGDELFSTLAAVTNKIFYRLEKLERWMLNELSEF